MPKADHARIADLERWHARRDCEERGHVRPEGDTPDPDAPEPIEIRALGSRTPIRIINGGPSCERCGESLPRAVTQD